MKFHLIHRKTIFWHTYYLQTCNAKPSSGTIAAVLLTQISNLDTMLPRKVFRRGFCVNERACLWCVCVYVPVQTSKGGFTNA